MTDIEILLSLITSLLSLVVLLISVFGKRFLASFDVVCKKVSRLEKCYLSKHPEDAGRFL